ncbi:MAG: hypothetical protein M3O34_03915, partial [Chloroflexota bacterium]|nr:hypothetical protein [Chloroflexota bacterium]
MAALAALARGIGKILGLLTGWLEGLRAPGHRPSPVRPIAGASDGTEEESPNGAARPPNRRRAGGRATATNGPTRRRETAGAPADDATA